MSRPKNRHRNRPYMCTLKVTRRVTSPITLSSPFLMRIVPLEDGNGDVRNPSGETSALWGGRWKEALREGPRVSTAFLWVCQIKRRMAWWMGKWSNYTMISGTEKFHKCAETLVWGPHAPPYWLTPGYGLYPYFQRQIWSRHGAYGVRVKGDDGQTVGHICLKAAPGCVLKQRMSISAVWNIHSLH